jgi:signal transduction histidine kinase
MNIMRRVEMLQGNIYLDSQPGKGTHYTIDIPL